MFAFATVCDVGNFGEKFLDMLKREHGMTYAKLTSRAQIAKSTPTRIRKMGTRDEMYQTTLDSILASIGWTLQQFNDWYGRCVNEDVDPERERVTIVMNENPRAEFDLYTEEYEKIESIAASRGVSVQQLIPSLIRDAIDAANATGTPSAMEEKRRSVTFKIGPLQRGSEIDRTANAADDRVVQAEERRKAELVKKRSKEK